MSATRKTSFRKSMLIYTKYKINILFTENLHKFYHDLSNF